MGCRQQLLEPDEVQWRQAKAGHHLLRDALHVGGTRKHTGTYIQHKQGSGLRAQGSGFRVQGSGLRAQGSRLRTQGSGLRAQGQFRETGPRSGPRSVQWLSGD